MIGCLMLPTLVAKNVCRELRRMLLVVPLVAVATAAAGFVMANHYDDPPAQMTVALLRLPLTMAWLVRRIR
jgi:ABC-type Mn2+/Zn2+ transport system permease subunit